MGQLQEQWDKPCPCQSERPLKDCCGSKIDGSAPAKNAEELMRSRYSAFVLQEIDYIIQTCHPETRDQTNRQEIAEWSRNSQWEGFHLIDTEGGQEGDAEGQVEFVARYFNQGKAQAHHERARFIKSEGRWYFHSGKQLENTYRRASPKIGRNDPCPCGSGKKFKKCCQILNPQSSNP